MIRNGELRIENQLTIKKIEHWNICRESRSRRSKNWKLRIANRFPDTGNVERTGAAAIGGHVLARFRSVVGVSARNLADSRRSEDVPSRQHGPEEPEGAADTSPDERVHGLGKGRAQKIGRRESWSPQRRSQ